MKLEQSTKRLLIILGAMILVYAGIQVYNAFEKKKDEESYQAMMAEIYAANPGLQEEMEQQEALLRTYGPRALEHDFDADHADMNNNDIRESKKLADGGEQVTVYFTQGKPREEYMLKEGKLEGEFKQWDQNGTLLETSEYSDNKLNGLQKNFYTTGELKVETQFVDGKKDGVSKNWYKNGKQSREINYSNNKVIGSTSFYPSGNIRLSEMLDEENGLTLTQAWYENGQLSHEFQSKDGKKEGLLVKNAPTGFKVVEAYYKDGVYDGWCRVWNENGELDVELYYNAGILDRSKNAIGKTCSVDLWRFGFR